MLLGAGWVGQIVMVEAAAVWTAAGQHRRSRTLCIESTLQGQFLAREEHCCPSRVLHTRPLQTRSVGNDELKRHANLLEAASAAAAMLLAASLLRLLFLSCRFRRADNPRLQPALGAQHIHKSAPRVHWSTEVTDSVHTERLTFAVELAAGFQHILAGLARGEARRNGTHW